MVVYKWYEDRTWWQVKKCGLFFYTWSRYCKDTNFKGKNNYSTFTSTIDQNKNSVPSEELYISTSSEYDFRNSHVDEPSFDDSDIDLENYFYTNAVIEYVVYHFYCFLIYYWQNKNTKTNTTNTTTNREFGECKESLSRKYD